MLVQEGRLRIIPCTKFRHGKRSYMSWQNYIDDIGFTPDHNEVPREFLQEVIEAVGDQCNFYTIDVGQMQNGQWIVIELNDGQFAGLSCNDPFKLYEGLNNVLKIKGL